MRAAWPSGECRHDPGDQGSRRVARLGSGVGVAVVADGGDDQFVAVEASPDQDAGFVRARCVSGPFDTNRHMGDRVRGCTLLTSENNTD